MRIDESRQYNTPACIYNFRVANILFDLVARTSFLDLPVANEHSAVANNAQLRQLCPYARSLWSSQGDQLRSVQDRE
jgi:hypothetical protein